MLGRWCSLTIMLGGYRYKGMILRLGLGGKAEAKVEMLAVARRA